MKNILSNMLTGIDGKTHDLGRYAWVVLLATFVGGTVYALVHGDPWDGIKFATAAGAINVMCAGALKVKESTEPKGTANDQTAA